MPGWIGVDPGLSGGVAWTNGEELYVAKMPATEKDMLDLSNTIKTNLNYGPAMRGGGVVPVHAVVEKVHAMPEQGVTSMFNFGQNFGMVKMMLTAAHISWELVTPQTWQKAFGLISTKRQTPTQKKNKHKAAAQGLFPQVKVTHAVADALLIMEFCRRIHGSV